jgi:hypothetical protein
VNSIWGKVIWYRNIGTRTSSRLGAAQPIEVEWDGPQPTMAYGWLRPEGKALLTQWRTTPVAVDWNRDGLVDLVMLDQEGYLAFFKRARRGGKLVLLSPSRAFHGENFSTTDSRHIVSNKNPGPIRLNHGIAGKSGRRKLCVVDWDGDGKLDFLVNSANANFLRQTGSRDGQWHFNDKACWHSKTSKVTTSARRQLISTATGSISGGATTAVFPAQSARSTIMTSHRQATG